MFYELLDSAIDVSRSLVGLLALYIIAWTAPSFPQWMRGKGLPLSQYRAGIFVLVTAICSFQIANVTDLIGPEWRLVNVLGLLAGLMIVAAGRKMAIDLDFDRLWRIYPRIRQAEALAEFYELLPDEADLIMDVVLKRIDAAKRGDTLAEHPELERDADA